jgi:hypothetical protein
VSNETPSADKAFKPIFDNMPVRMSAHAVRALRPCRVCKGVGDGHQMIQLPGWTRAELVHYHTGCYIRSVGFKSALNLSPEEMGKFRMCDLTTMQMIRLSRARSKKLSSADPEVKP